MAVGDTFFHLLLIESIRTRKWRYPSVLENVTFSEIDTNCNYLAYPPLFHFIVSLFPKRLYLKITKYFSIVNLSLLTSIAGTLVFAITSNIAFALLSSFLVIFNFSALSLVIQFSPRPLGLFFYSLIVCIAVFYPVNFISLFAVAFLVMLLALTHKFALQALSFGLLPYALLFSKFYLLPAFLIGLLFTIVITKGFYLKILKEHLYWLRFYKLRPRKISVKTILTSIFGGNAWSFLIAVMILLTFLQNGSSKGIVTTNLVMGVAFWAFINVLLALFVSIPSLSFLGEYNRYVEYSVLSIGIVVFLIAPKLSIFFLFPFLASVVISLIAVLKYRQYLLHTDSFVDPDDIVSYRSLTSFNLSNILVLPGARSLEVRYFSGLSVIHPVRGPTTPLAHITNLTEYFEIRYVVKFKANDAYNLFSTLSSLKKIHKVADFKNFEVYQISN